MSTNIIKEGYKKEVREAAKALSDGLDFEPIHKVPMDYFDLNYLPILKPLLEGGDINQQEWISLTEHPLVSIAVYDGDKCIFIVPPLLKSISTATNPADGTSIADAAKLLPSYTADSPMQSKRFYSALLSKTITGDDRRVDRDGLEQICKIAKHYDIKGPYLELLNTVAIKADAPADFDEWEDLE